MPTQELNPQAELADAISEYTDDPEGFVLFAYPWGEGELEDSAGPRDWQRTILAQVHEHLRNPATRHHPCRIAVSSGNGIGKSALIGMLIDWAMSTCEDTKVMVTAGTGTQLSTKTVPEVSTWFRRAINEDWWDVKATSISSRQPKHEKTWRTDFVTWDELNPEAFAGMHNRGKRILIVFDEASAIADPIWETVEGALTDENTEIIWVAFGNPTRNQGAFRECFRDRAHLWKHHKIDSRTVDGTNKTQIQEWLETNGADSDWFRVHVRGEFPRASDIQFIDSERIEQAQRRSVVVSPDEPLIAAVDFAWGGDDNNVIRFRKGKDARSIPPIRVAGEQTRDATVMTVQLAEILSQTWNGDRIHTLFADSAGIAGDVVSRLRRLGHSNVIEVNFMADSPDIKYANMRAFMWGRTKEWLLTGAIDPKDKMLAADLASPGYRMDNQVRVLLEKKDEIKKRIGRSPDDGDALALTFPYVVAAKREKQPIQHVRPVSAWG